MLELMEFAFQQDVANAGTNTKSLVVSIYNWDYDVDGTGRAQDLRVPQYEMRKWQRLAQILDVEYIPLVNQTSNDLENYLVNLPGTLVEKDAKNLFVFYSGHGKMCPGSPYTQMVGVDNLLVDTGLFFSSDFCQYRIMIIMDCCRTEATDEEAISAPAPSEEFPIFWVHSARAHCKAADGEDRTAFTEAFFDRIAFEWEQLQNHNTQTFSIVKTCMNVCDYYKVSGDAHFTKFQPPFDIRISSSGDIYTL